jgi:1-acyl-sn-glycerol-3-phosphate acyltransferase
VNSGLWALGLAVVRAAAVFGAAYWLMSAGGGAEALLVGAGAAAGCAAAGWQTHPRRARGWAAPGATALAAALAWVAFDPTAPLSTPAALFIGAALGVVAVALRSLDPTGAAAGLPRWERAYNAFRDPAAAALLLVLFDAARRGRVGPPDVVFPAAALACAAAAAAAWVLLLPQTLELFAEFLLSPMYRVGAHGPGADRLPRRGPLLIVANHSSYADPFWLGKFVPRKITPMMTSRFFDLPVIRWLMRRLVGAIRVPAAGFRREAPELRDAVRVLRRGGCLVIFPEGSLRREEGRPLRPFGQGVWHVLHELPDTPAVVCWIEGGWGSWASYKGGPPFRGKRPDWRRRIDVAVSVPAPLPPAVLADQRATRDHLRRACAECRTCLGLPPPQETAGAGEQDKEGGPAAGDVHPIHP